MDPADLIVDLKPIVETMNEYREATWKPELIEATDPVVGDWKRSALIRLSVGRDFMDRDTTTDWAKYFLGPEAEPKGSYPVCGLANIYDWDALRLDSTWKQLVEEYGTGDVGAPTTLGRIDPDLARRLIGRSYLNTYLVSLFLAPLSSGELDSLPMLSSRIGKVVGNANP